MTVDERWHITEDLDDFLSRAGDFLRSLPALHNTPLTDIEKLRIGGPESGGARTAVFGLLESAGEARAVLYRTPRGRLGMTPLSADRTDRLADHLADLGLEFTNVIADRATATAFADAWRRRTRATADLFWRTHLYRLDTLTPPHPLPPGRGRTPSTADHDQLVRWCREFCVAVDEQRSIDLIDAGAWSESRFSDRHFTFWETPDGTPVSMAAATSLIGGMIRIDPVYTPADLRGRGYAAAVTTEASRAALAAGAREVVLFTDPDNPTSNALYQRLGYVRIDDFAGYRFS